MKPIRESLIGGALLLVVFMLLLMVAERISPEAGGSASAPAAVTSHDSQFVMHGAGGATLLVKPVSTAEYEALTALLYLNGVVNEQGQVQDGMLVYTACPESSAAATAYIGKIDAATGAVETLAAIDGCLDGVPHFSPSGERIAFLCGADPALGTNDVCIVDTDTGTAKLLSEAAGGMSGAISDVQWLDDNTVYTCVF